MTHYDNYNDFKQYNDGNNEDDEYIEDVHVQHNALEDEYQEEKFETLESLREKLYIAEEDIKQASMYGMNLLNQVKQLESEKKELEDKYDEARSHIQELEQELGEISNENSRLRSECDTAKENMDAYEYEINKMERENEYLRQFEIANNKFKKEIESLKAVVQDWNRKSESWKEENHQNEITIEAQKKTIVDLRFRLETAQQDEKKDSVSIKQYETLQKELLETSRELRQLKTEQDMERMKSYQEKTTFLSEQKELINQLEDQEKIAAVKKELQIVRRAISTLRQTSKSTKEECTNTLENMREEISSISLSLSSFINKVPISTGETVKYKIVDEVGYAQMQAKVIQDLGLDNMYASLGKEKIIPQKMGYMDVCTHEKKNLFGRNIFHRRWVVFSSISVSIYMDSETSILERRESLEGVKIGLGQGQEFFLYFPSKAKLVLRGDSPVQRDEWFTFVERLASQLNSQPKMLRHR